MKTDKDIENLLREVKKLSLTTDEKLSIKSMLITQATKSLQYENKKQSNKFSWGWWVTRGSMAFASLVLVFASTAYVAQGSLPGEPLYAMKIHVVEEMIAFTKSDPQTKIAYDLELIEIRFAELKVINEQGKVPKPEMVATVANQIHKHATDATNVISNTDSLKLSHEKKIEALSKMTTIVDSQAKTVNYEKESSDITEISSTVLETIPDVVSVVIEDFVTTNSVETVGDYLSKQIDMVGEQLTVSSVSEEVRDLAGQHLYNVHEALIDGDLSSAILSVFEAQQEIQTGEYLQNDID
jgi:hypothetical protein